MFLLYKIITLWCAPLRPAWAQGIRKAVEGDRKISEIDSEIKELEEKII